MSLSDDSNAFALKPNGDRIYWNSIPFKRLLAVAEYGFDSVANNGVRVKNGIPFDLRSENIEIVDYTEKGVKAHAQKWEDRKYRDEEWLREQVEELNRDFQDIADECGVTKACIYIYTDKFDIEYERVGYVDAWSDKKYRDEKWLQEQVEEKERSLHDIADECDVTRDTIKNYVDKFGIDFSIDRRYRDKEWLKEQYVNKDKSIEAIADEVSVIPKTVQNWVYRHQLNLDKLDSVEGSSINESFGV